MAFIGLYWQQRPNSNCLFRAPIHEGFALSIWFCYYRWFPRTLTCYADTNKPKSARKYLFDNTSKYFFNVLSLLKSCFSLLCPLDSHYAAFLFHFLGNDWLFNIHSHSQHGYVINGVYMVSEPNMWCVFQKYTTNIYISIMTDIKWIHLTLSAVFFIINSS